MGALDSTLGMSDTLGLPKMDFGPVLSLWEGFLRRQGLSLAPNPRLNTDDPKRYAHRALLQTGEKPYELFVSGSGRSRLISQSALSSVVRDAVL